MSPADTDVFKSPEKGGGLGRNSNRGGRAGRGRRDGGRSGNHHSSKKMEHGRQEKNIDREESGEEMPVAAASSSFLSPPESQEQQDSEQQQQKPQTQPSSLPASTPRFKSTSANERAKQNKLISHRTVGPGQN